MKAMPNGKGINGWLNPNGVLIVCNYREHAITAEKILNEIKNDGTIYCEEYLRTNAYIPLSSGWGSAVHIGEDNIITLQQRKWLEDNFELMDKAQQFCVGVSFESRQWTIHGKTYMEIEEEQDNER